MKQLLTFLAITVITSLYIFPFTTVWLPSVNTKMVLAGLAPFILLVRGAKLSSGQLSPQIIKLSACSLIVSLVGFISVILNNTHDYTYASYFVSMWVWLGGAYVVIKSIDFAYGKATVRLVGIFFIAASVIQCLLSQVINANEVIADWVDSFMASTGFMGKNENRLYGIGCALDVAGMKFCAVLVIIAYFSVNPQTITKRQFERCAYIFAFFIVAIFGSMIARTTFIGIILSIILWIVLYIYYSNNSVKSANWVATGKLLVISLVFVLPIVFLFYHTNQEFHDNLRFGFEGVFSWYEKGEWVVRSNKQLESMVIWPDNIKTWLIGDGYFENPMNDFYYTGPLYAYYMGTDVGYCRFIFYFGVLGLLAFSSVFVCSAIVCSKTHPEYAIIFLFFLFINFIVWMKVSSDLFSVFALFLCLDRKENKEYENCLSYTGS